MNFIQLKGMTLPPMVGHCLRLVPLWDSATGDTSRLNEGHIYPLLTKTFVPMTGWAVFLSVESLGAMIARVSSNLISRDSEIWVYLPVCFGLVCLVMAFLCLFPSTWALVEDRVTKLRINYACSLEALGKIGSYFSISFTLAFRDIKGNIILKSEHYRDTFRAE